MKPLLQVMVDLLNLMSKNIRLLPPFNEKDVDKYFILFERVASTLKWPKNVWALLLQCVLSGKAEGLLISSSRR